MSLDNQTSEFVVTARKWRPNLYKEVVGQEHITTTLQNAIKTERIHHAYLFCGPRGVGKTTTARIHARAVNCENLQNFEPCNECEPCKSILDARNLDVIEIDGASNNGVDDIRKLRDNSKYPPVNCKYKMYIIDEVHMLSDSAFNALLKTLEEPPTHLLFVFATTEAHKVPSTIISRCQRFDFRRMELSGIVKQLSMIAKSENITIEERSLMKIAQKGDGSMRDSQSIFDQVIAFCGKDVNHDELTDALHLIDEEFFFRITDSIKTKNLGEIFTITKEVVTRGYDLQECLLGLLEHFRNILTIKITNDDSMLYSSQNYIDKYKEDAAHFDEADLIRMMNMIVKAEKDLKFSPQPRIRFEIVLVQLASMDKTIEIQTLLNEIAELKKK